MLSGPGPVDAVASAGTRLALEAVLAGVVGLVVGSFLNVVVYRVPLGLSISHPRSFCPSCRTPVAARDNVPVVSWLALRGRCRSCGAPIAGRYPAVEGLTGLSFAAVALAIGAHWSVPGFCALAATAIAGAATALDGWTPPASVAQLGTALGSAGLLAAAAAGGGWDRLVGAALGVAAVGLADLVSSVALRRAAVGRSVAGGLPALLPAGAWLGWLGWQSAAAGVGAAAVAAGGLAWWRRRGAVADSGPTSRPAAARGSDPNGAPDATGDPAGIGAHRLQPGGWAACAAVAAMAAGLVVSAVLGTAG